MAAGHGDRSRPSRIAGRVYEMVFLLDDVRVKPARSFFSRRWAFRLVTAALLLSPLALFGTEDDALSVLLEKIDRAERERVNIYKTLGAIYEEIGDTDKAIESYRMGFQVFRDAPILSQKLISLCTAKERWAELIPVYKSLVYANPGANEMYRKKLAECYLKGGQPDEAVAVINELLHEYGEDDADYRDAAQTLMTYEQYEQAASVCQRGIEGGFEQSSVLHYLLGQATAKLGQYNEAISAYKRAIELCDSQRDRKILQQELADLCKEEPIVEQVLEEKTESLKAMDERLAELYWQKALREEKDGKQDAAAALYQKIVSLVPGSERGKAAEKKIQGLSGP